MRPRCSLVLVCAIVLSGGPAWAGEEFSSGRVRGLDPAAVKLIEEARAGSATVRTLLDRLDRSDLIVYVQLVPRFEKPRAATAIISAVPEARFVMISITTLSGRADRYLLLGHELRHAVELADAPHVRDRLAMSAHYERIGWRDRPNVYETAAALETGHAVRQEMVTAARGVRSEAVVASRSRAGAAPGAPPVPAPREPSPWSH